jgi:O-antigen/teichoic acid export membrane protein
MWAFADQAALSMGTLVISLGAARTLGITEFGIFGAAQLVVFLVSGVWQAAFGESAILAGPSSDHGFRTYAGVVMSASLLTATLLAVLTTSFLLAFSTLNQAIVVAAGATFVALAAQDGLRYGYAARKAYGRSFIGSVIASVVFVVGAFSLDGRAPVEAWLWLWFGGTAAGVLLTAAFTRTHAPLSATARWTNENKRSLIRFGADHGFVGLCSQGGLLVAFARIGAPGIAGIRGAQILFSPVNVVLNGLRAIYLPRMVAARGAGREKETYLRYQLVLLIGGLSAAILLLSIWVGPVLLGDSFTTAESILVPFAVQYFFLGWYWAIVLHARAAERRDVVSIVRLTLGVATFAGVIVGAWVFGVLGVVWSLAASSGLSVLVGELLVLRRPK